MQLSSWHAVILCWCVVPLTLGSCTSPQLPVERVGGCAAGQTRSSCFYQEDPQHANTKLIIFVHGVFGSQSTTWGNPNDKNFWPKLILKDIRFVKGFDIYLINYRTPYIQEAPNIHEIAGNELGKLDSRGLFSRYQEIHFITHSMGGLVTKSMLTRLNRGEDIKKLRKVTSVVYLATPAQGARSAELGAWFSLNPQLNDLARAHVNTYIQSLEDQWVQLIEDRDKARGEFPRAYCSYETVRVGPLVIVPRELAASRCDGPLYPMPFNHLDITEPTTMDDDPYLWTMAKIVEAGATVEMRRKAASLVEDANRMAISGKHGEARKAYDDARALFQKIDDTQGRANVLWRLGKLEELLGRNDEARSAYTEARRFFQAVGDRVGEANVLMGLGDLESVLGKPDQARSAYTVARGLYEAESYRVGEADVLVGLGALEGILGRHNEARSAYTAARSLYKTEGNQRGEANLLVGLGELERRLGRYKEARTYYKDARILFQKTGNQLGEGNVLLVLGELERLEGRHNDARGDYTDARILFQKVGDQLGEGNVLVGLGLLERELGEHDKARKAYTEAGIFFRTVGARLGEGNVFVGLGELESALGRPDQARNAYTEARRIFQVVSERVGEAQVLERLGELEVQVNGKLARQYFYQAALLFEQSGMHDRRDRVLNEANNVPCSPK
jgi:tetratricopeptide (TPR) repeat protein